MKFKLLITSLLLICTILTKSQEIGINEKLLLQLTTNQTVRVVSNRLMKNKFKEQNDSYENIKGKTASILMIHNYIYDKLRNVNESISQGKRLYYSVLIVEEIIGSTSQLIDDASDYPLVASTLENYYTYVYEEAIGIQSDIQNVILKEEDGFLMDTYDRGVLIDKIYSRLKNINNTIKYISVLIDARRNKPLIYYAPVIGEYVIMDKQMVDGIMQRWNFIIQ